MANLLTQILGKIKKLFANTTDLQGSAYSASYSRFRNFQLNLPESPIRPVLGDLNNSLEMIEMLTWCYEFNLCHQIEMKSTNKIMKNRLVPSRNQG